VERKDFVSQTPLRDLFKEILSPLPNRIAVATSGGISSAALLASAVEAGKTPTVTSFTFEGHYSTDFLYAKNSLTSSAQILSLSFCLLTRQKSSRQYGFSLKPTSSKKSAH
jgi:hypothetical protein